MNSIPFFLRSPIAFLSAFTALTALAHDHGRAHDDRPNFVLIVTDDQNTFDYATYGGNVLTPHVDRLASEGVRFDNAYTVTTVCSPSRYATLTGRLPGRCTHPDFFRVSPKGSISRVSNRSMTLEKDRPNLMKSLQASGYTTGIAGKWHLGTWMAGWEEDGVWLYPPGFHEMELKSYPRDAAFDDPEFNEKLAYNQSRFRDELSTYGWDTGNAIIWMNPRELHHDGLNNHNQEWITHGATSFIKEHADEPFFLYMATTISHVPDPRETLNRDDDPRHTGSGYMTDHLGVQASRATIAERVAKAGTDPDLAYLTWLDDGIGAIIRTLEDEGIADNTVIILISDHGFTGKATLYESGTHVPFIVHSPARFAPATSDLLVQNLDIAPTILELAGIEPGEDMILDGQSLVPLLEQSLDEDSWREDLYFEYGYARAIRYGSWKYISIRYPAEDVVAYRNGAADRLPSIGFNRGLGAWQAERQPHYWETDQLYNLEEDPQESQNLSSDPAYSDILVEMKQRLIPRLAIYPDRPYGELFIPATEE